MKSKLLNSIGNFFADTLRVFVNEFKNIVTNGDVLIIFILATLAYPLLYGFIYSTNAYLKTPIAVVDYSGGSKSQAFSRMVAATPDIDLKARCANFAEAQQRLKDGEVRGILLISRDFDRNIRLNRQADISIYVDMGSFLYFKNVMLGLMQTTLAEMRNIRIAYFTAQGNTEQQALVNAEPIPIEGMIIYNNEGTYGNYLLPGVLVLILHQTLVLGIGILAGREKARRRYGLMLPVSARPLGLFRVIAGKTFSYLALYGVLGVYALGLVPKLFHLPDIGNPITIMLFMLPFLLATIYFAITIGIFMKTDESAFLLFVFTSVALLLMAGPYWSPENMPWAWRTLRWMLPAPMGVIGFIKINVMGGTLNDVRAEYIALWIQTLVYGIVATVTYGFYLGRLRWPQRAKEVPLR